ncbi:MAG: DUF3090 family protein [Thermomicrobiales bacterium]|nr:DUF3090 family protein [Thermomicrobiales bacterium]
MEFESQRELDAQRVRAEALGEPGKRRFRLLVVIDGDTHVAWMEKQQLQALGLALEQMLEQIPHPDVESAAPPASQSVEFDQNTRSQFRVGRMELGYDERSDRLVIIAHDINQDDDDEEEDEEAPGTEDEPALTFRLTREQAREISAEAAAVVAAGRPRCTMCGAPIGPEPHVCPQQNGHLPHELESTSPDDE